MSTAPPDVAAPAAASAAAAASPAADDHIDMSELGFFGSDSEEDTAPVPPRRLLRAEAILARRTARLLLVVETLQDENNHQAVLRTADSFGIQHVWIVRSGIPQKQHRARNVRNAQTKVSARAIVAAQAAHGNVDESLLPETLSDATGSVSMAAGRWLTLRYFDSTAECIAALREDNRTIWVSSLSPGAKRLDLSFHASGDDSRGPRIPERLAVVLGREIDGVSPEMTAAASLSVFLPMRGFSESFNVSVAAALLCQRITDLVPECEGDLPAEEKAHLRSLWYAHLSAATPALVDEYIGYWLPRAAEVEAEMRRVQDAESAAEARGDASASASSAFGGMSSLLRPPEVSRVPKVNRKVRERMQREGQRAVVLPHDPNSLPREPAKTTIASAPEQAAQAAP